MTSPLMQVRGATMDFSGLRALSGVDFDVAEGAITGIIGPNGAGKTTLFNVIAGNYKPTAGRVLFADREITGLAPNKICRMGISRTYQSVRPFLGLSVLNNVKVALLYGRRQGPPTPGRIEQEIVEILRFVHLGASGDKRAEELIPLDRKRLEIARALATNPRLLMLDEVIAGLTPRETLEMMDTIRQINQRGITVLLIEHVMRAVMGLCNQIIVLHHGEKIAEGDPVSISQDETVIKAYLGSQL
ncbi:MAG: ABC transporter ATP-binding protein [Candidatus Methylomirabilia bacterium]